MRDLEQSVRKVLGIQLTPVQLEALERYEKELLTWNKRYNLTAIDEPDIVRKKHFLDSLSCLIAMRETPSNQVIDVGTGAGFPGLPLKIVCPGMQLTLVESVGKKATFCRHIINTLALDKVEVIQDRAEKIGQNPDHREQYDWAIARAVAIMPVLAEYLLPLVRVGGGALAMKGESAPVEAQASEHALRLLGGKLKRLAKITLPGVAEERFLVTVDKVATTPPTYPRRVGMPAKRPLQ